MHARPASLEARLRYAPGRLLAIGVCLCVIAVAAGGCGRRGKLEAPTGSAQESSSKTTAPASPRSLPLGTGTASGTAPPEADAVRDGDELPNVATPAGTDSAPVQTGRGAKKGYKIPKDPFILDAIL